MSAKQKNEKLTDQVAIVTGAGSGIGAATARLLAANGAKVAVVDLDGSVAQKVADEIERQGGQALSASLDVAVQKDIQKLVDKVMELWGRIDILVNNAGMGEECWFIDSRESMWDRTIDVNLKGTLFFCQAVLPDMMERGSGKIVNIASSAAKLGTGKLSIYSAAKAAVSGFTKALAREVAPYNIHVNDICPGPIHTPHFEQLEPTIQKMAVKTTSFRRPGRPEEIATAVLFLASDDSSYITGHSLMVDGGQTML